MERPPQTQFQLSELERDQYPVDPVDELNRRRRLSMSAKASLYNSFCDAGDKLPPPIVSDEQAVEYATVLAASLRRLVADVDWALRTLGSVDTSLVVRSALVSSTKVLEEASAWKPEGPTDAVA